MSVTQLAGVSKRTRATRSRGGSNRVDVEITMPDNLEDLLSKIEAEIRLKYLTKALNAAGKVVAQDARRRITAPGYKGDKTKRNPRLVPLRKSMTWVVRSKGRNVYCYVGPEYSGSGTGGGNHGHLVEFGHRLIRNGKEIGRVPPKPFLRPAAMATKAEQQAIIVKALQEAAA